MSLFKSLTETSRVEVRRAYDLFPERKSEPPEATVAGMVELGKGDTFTFHAGLVRKRIGETKVAALAFNGSSPGPTLKVAQGSEVSVHFANQAEREATVHWHGLSLGGEPDELSPVEQLVTSAGDSLTYKLHFPDPGVFWYYANPREPQALSAYGSVVVLPADPDYWTPVNREYSLILDDIPMPHSSGRASSPRMARFTRAMLVNGESNGTLLARCGDVVRLYLTNAAALRIFRFRIPGVRLKLIGFDRGRVERETFVEEVLIAPAERAVVDVHFDEPGTFGLEHRIPGRSYSLGTALVTNQTAKTSLKAAFEALRYNADFEAESSHHARNITRLPDQTLTLGDETDITKDRSHLNVFAPAAAETEHTDQATSRASEVSDRVKLRLVNKAGSEHLVYLRGQRFLVLSRDGVPTTNFAWKDTLHLCSREVADILVAPNSRTDGSEQV